MRCRALLLFALLLAASPALASDLSPPWWATYSLFREALQRDPCLNVSTLEPAAPPRHASAAFAFNITLLQCENACDAKLAGLATFLTAHLNFGGTAFVARVLNSSGHAQQPAVPASPAQALILAGAALAGNPWFVRTATSSPFPCLDFYWVVFAPEVAQVWVDNLADLWGNINMLAADLFSRVMRLERFGLRATTLQFEPHVHSSARQQRQGSAGLRQAQPQAPQQGQQRTVQRQQLACAPGQRCYPVGTDAWEAEAEWLSGGLAAGAAQQQQHQRPSARPWQLPEVQQAAEDDKGLLQLTAFERLWRRDQPQGMQQQAVVRAGSWRRLLAVARADASSVAPPWRIAAQCWALGLARSVGGEWAVLRAQRWLGLDVRQQA